MSFFLPLDKHPYSIIVVSLDSNDAVWNRLELHIGYICLLFIGFGIDNQNKI